MRTPPRYTKTSATDITDHTPHLHALAVDLVSLNIQILQQAAMAADMLAPKDINTLARILIKASRLRGRRLWRLPHRKIKSELVVGGVEFRENKCLVNVSKQKKVLLCTPMEISGSKLKMIT